MVQISKIEKIEDSLRGWVEYNRMMGVQKIYTYMVKSDIPSQSNVPSILRTYRRLGVIDLVQLQDLNIYPPQLVRLTSKWGWWMDIESIKDRQPVSLLEIPSRPVFGHPQDQPSLQLQRMSRTLLHSFGEILAYQDCLMRSVGRHRWMFFYDLDEYLVPHLPLALTETLPQDPEDLKFSPHKYSPYAEIFHFHLEKHQQTNLKKVLKSGSRILYPNLVHGIGFYHQLICPYDGPVDHPINTPPDCKNPLSRALARTYSNVSTYCRDPVPNIRDKPASYQCLIGFSDSSIKSPNLLLHKLFNVIYEQTLYRPFHRSKFAIDPMLVSSMGVHFAFETLINRLGPQALEVGGIKEAEEEWGEGVPGSETKFRVKMHRAIANPKGYNNSDIIKEMKKRKRFTRTGKPLAEAPSSPQKWPEFILMGTLRKGLTLSNENVVRWVRATFHHQPSSLKLKYSLPSKPPLALSPEEKFLLLFMGLNGAYRTQNDSLRPSRREDLFVERDVAILQHRRAYIFNVRNSKLGTCRGDFQFVNRFGGLFLFHFFTWSVVLLKQNFRCNPQKDDSDMQQNSVHWEGGKKNKEEKEVKIFGFTSLEQNYHM